MLTITTPPRATRSSPSSSATAPSRTSLIPILQDVKKAQHEITDEAMQIVADLLGIHPVEVYSVATFYAFLHGAPEGRFVLRLCGTLSCDFAGKTAVAEALRGALGIDFGETTDDGVFTLEWASCVGMCDQGPALLVNDKVFTRVTPEKVAEIVAEYRAQGAPSDEPSGHRHASATTSPTPASSADAGLKAALAHVARATSSTPSRDAGLKGRGGAGFPTGMKWNFCAAEKGDQKYIICNADEGEPGTFKDRVILRDFADLVFEGMTIGGRAIGATHGHRLPARPSTPTCAPHLNEVIQRRREAGLLGKNVGGVEGFDFDIVVALRRRRLRLRRGDGPHRVARGLPRRAAQPPAVPGRRRLPQPADGRQQRRDPGLGGLHLRQGHRLVQGLRHRQVDRLQALQHLRRLRQARRLRVPLGHHRGRPAQGGRRRAAPRRCRSAAPRASACRPATSSAGWPSRTSPPAARSW